MKRDSVSRTKCQETARVSSRVPLNVQSRLSCGIPYKDEFMRRALGAFLDNKPGRLLPGTRLYNSSSESHTIPVPPRKTAEEHFGDRPYDPDTISRDYPGGKTRYEYLLQGEREGTLNDDLEYELEFLRSRSPEARMAPRYQVQPAAQTQKKKKGRRRLREKKVQGPAPKVGAAPRAFPTISSSIASNSLAVSAPTARTNINRSGIPRIRYLPNGDVRVAHREFILDLPGSVAFAITTLNLNPGLPSVFNWLYRLAQSFESWIVHSLQVCFETESATGATGTVAIAIDYDPGDAPPTTKAQALAYRGTVRSAPWTASCHTSLLEDLRKRSSYFVRGGSLLPGQDVTLFDVGNLYLITQGMASTAVVGEIWIKYDIEFRTPKTLSAGGGNAVWSQFSATSNSTFVLTNGNLPVSFVLNTPGAGATAVFTFLQPWQGTMTLFVNGTGINIVNANVSGAAGVNARIITDNTGSNAAGYALVNANAGQTLSVLFTNTTINSTLLYFCQGTGAFN